MEDFTLTAESRDYMSETSSQSTSAPARKTSSIIIVLSIIVVLVGATWWLGERNGWANIGTGGQNAQLLPKVGEEAPEFFTLSESGEPILLSQLRGQPVWLNFWGSWCAPCRAEMPEFKAAYKELSAQGIVILPVSTGEAPEQAIAYRNLVGGTFPVYIDPNFISSFVNADENPQVAARFESLRNDWQIMNYPTHVFIDADGIVRNVVLAQMTEEEMITTALSLKEPRSAVLPEIVVTRFD